MLYWIVLALVALVLALVARHHTECGTHYLANVSVAALTGPPTVS